LAAVCRGIQWVGVYVSDHATWPCRVLSICSATAIAWVWFGWVLAHAISTKNNVVALHSDESR
jgi:hypothetical protein